MNAVDAWVEWVETNGPSVTALVLFCFGAAPLSKIAQLQSPRAHSFNQSLSRPYIFVYYHSDHRPYIQILQIGHNLFIKLFMTSGFTNLMISLHFIFNV